MTPEEVKQSVCDDLKRLRRVGTLLGGEIPSHCTSDKQAE